MEFINKNILITGASTGIGKALAFELAKVKCNLILIARSLDLLDEFVQNVKDFPANIYTVKCDVSKKDEVLTAYEKIKKKHAIINIAILNAGRGSSNKNKQYDSNIGESIFNTNLFGIIYWVEKLLPDFLKHGSGTIAGVSSLADNRGHSGSGFYCASKAAVSIYLEGLRIELKKHNINIITIKPGFVKTPMTDKNDFYMPLIISSEKAAKVILHGIKKNKRIVQFPLTAVIGSKIVGILPGWLYEFLALNYFKK